MNFASRTDCSRVSPPKAMEMKRNSLQLTGVETVRALAQAGARVLLLSRSVEAGQKVASNIKAEGASVSFLSIDRAVAQALAQQS